MKNFNFNVVASTTQVGFSTELKENISMNDGNATIDTCDLVTKTLEDSQDEYLAVNLRFKGVDGGGCYDTVTSRTASKLKLGLDRIKYLFASLGVVFPELAFFRYAILGQENETMTVLNEALVNYEARGGQPEAVVSIDQGSNILFFNRKKDYTDVVADNPSITFLFKDLETVGRLKREHGKNIREIRNGDMAESAKESAVETAKSAYYASLDAQPVIPCSIVAEDITALHEAINSIGNSKAFYVKTSNNGKQVKAYEAMKA